MKPDEVLNMDIGLFLGLRKQFFIMDLQQTEEGRNKLKDAERYTGRKQTDTKFRNMLETNYYKNKKNKNNG